MPIDPHRRAGWTAPADLVDLVIFDADDTLWKSEDYFRELGALFSENVGPFGNDGIDVADALHTTEIGNVGVTGYGVAAYTLSMVEAAIAATGGRVPAAVLTTLIQAGYEILTRDVEVLDGVIDALDQIGSTHRLAVITKGDLLHQRRKLERSGIADRFERTRVVREKDAETYRAVFAEWAVDPQRVLMVGNSLRSDVLPILELGGHAAHIPYHVTWEHEAVDSTDHETEHGQRWVELSTISDLNRWFRSPSEPAIGAPRPSTETFPAI